MANTKTTLRTQAGKETGAIELPAHVFARPVDKQVLSEAIVIMQKNLRVPTSHAKDRSEKRGGGRKPWRQKGTGRARHGSNRSPLWAGGGVTHGPLKTRNNKRKVNQKVKNASLAMALSGKHTDEEIFFVDALSLDTVRTKDMVSVLKNVLGERYGTGTVLLVVDEADETLKKSMRNIPNVSLQRAASLNAYDALAYTFIVMTQSSVDILEKRLS